jgi:hypothetical protein
VSLRGLVQRDDMKAARRSRRREDLVEKLEALHQLCAQADAFHAAFEALYGETSWPTDGDPERRLALNRMSCFVDALSKTLTDLLRTSQEAVEFAIER